MGVDGRDKPGQDGEFNLPCNIISVRVAAIALILFTASSLARAEDVPALSPKALAEGVAVYKKANCVGCHKWHGDGGGGYGGAALSLRKTILTRDQIIETVKCGRPGVGMPFHIRDIYDDETKPCFGLGRADLTGQMPPSGAVFLRQPEIEAVADYVLANIKGKGDVNLADCEAFFGKNNRQCSQYDKPAQ